MIYGLGDLHTKAPPWKMPVPNIVPLPWDGKGPGKSYLKGQRDLVSRLRSGELGLLHGL